MKTKARKMAVIALSIAAIVSAGSANGGSRSAGMDGKEVQNVNPPAAEQDAAEPYLAKHEVAEILESQGYTNIKKIELEKGEYEVKARDADGRHVEIYADPRTGKILKSEYEE